MLRRRELLWLLAVRKEKKLITMLSSWMMELRRFVAASDLEDLRSPVVGLVVSMGLLPKEVLCLKRRSRSTS